MPSGDAPGFPRPSGSGNQASSSGYGQQQSQSQQYGAPPPSGFLGSAWSNLLTTNNHAPPLLNPGQGQGTATYSTFSAREVQSTSIRAQHSSGSHAQYPNAMQAQPPHHGWQQHQQAPPHQSQQHQTPMHQQQYAGNAQLAQGASTQHGQGNHPAHLPSNAPSTHPYSSPLQGRSSPAQQPSSQPPATATRAAAQFAQYHAQRPGRFTSAWSNNASSSSPDQHATHASSSSSSNDPVLPPISSIPGYHQTQPQAGAPSYIASATVSPPQHHPVPPHPSFSTAAQPTAQGSLREPQASYPPSGPATFPSPVPSTTAQDTTASTIPSPPLASSSAVGPPQPTLRSPTSEARTSLNPGHSEQSFSQLRMFAYKFESQHSTSSPQHDGTSQAPVRGQRAQQAMATAHHSGPAVRQATSASTAQANPQAESAPAAATANTSGTGSGAAALAPLWSRQLVPAASSSPKQSADQGAVSPQSSQPKEASLPSPLPRPQEASQAPGAAPTTPTTAMAAHPTTPTSAKARQVVHSRVVPISDSQVSPPRKIIDIASSRSAGYVRPSDLTKPMYALETVPVSSSSSASQALQAQQAMATPAAAGGPSSNAPTESAIAAAASAVSQVMNRHPAVSTPASTASPEAGPSPSQAPAAASQSSQMPSTEWPAPKPKAGRGRPRGTGPRQLEAKRQQEAREAAVREAMISERVDPDAHPGMLAAVLAAAQPTKVTRPRKSAPSSGSQVAGSDRPAAPSSDTEIVQAIGQAMQSASQPVAQAISQAVQTAASSTPRRSTTSDGTPRKMGRPRGSGPLQKQHAAATRAAIIEAGLDPDTVSPEVKATFEAKFKHLRIAKPTASAATSDSSNIGPATPQLPTGPPLSTNGTAAGPSTGATLVARAAASTSALATVPAVQTNAGPAPRAIAPHQAVTRPPFVPLSMTALPAGSVPPHLVGPTLSKYVQMRQAAASPAAPPAPPVVSSAARPPGTELTTSAPSAAKRPRGPEPSASPHPPQNRAVVDLTRQSPVAPRKSNTKAATAETTTTAAATPARPAQVRSVVDRVVVDLSQTSPVRSSVAATQSSKSKPKPVGPINRAQVVIPISKARREQLIARGVYDVFRDDTDIPPDPVGPKPPRVRVGPEAMSLQVAVPRGAALRQQIVREPEPIRDRFEHRTDTAMVEPWASVLTKESLLNRVGEYTCVWKGCGAQLATEAWLLRHIIARDHAGQAAFDFGGMVLYQCHWRGCDQPSFRTAQGLIQHVTAKHVCDRLDCPYEKCDLRSPTISHLYRHVMRTHDGGEQPRPRADLPFNPPPLDLQPLPDTVTTMELTIRPARGTSHKNERYQEYARAKVQRLCVAPTEPNIHPNSPPHMLQAIEGEDDALPATREATEADNGSVQFEVDDGIDVDLEAGVDSEEGDEDVVFEEIIVAVEGATPASEREASSTPSAQVQAAPAQGSRKRKRESNGPPTRQMARRTGAREPLPTPASGATTRRQSNGQPTRQMARRTGARGPLPVLDSDAGAGRATRSNGRVADAASSRSQANGRAPRSRVKVEAEDRSKGKGRAQLAPQAETPSRTARSGRTRDNVEPGLRQFISHIEVPKVDTSGYRQIPGMAA